MIKLNSLCFFFILSLHRVLSESFIGKDLEHASLPPRGWNSYDSFCWTISEQEFLENAQLVANRLLSHGYEYVVVDYLWYRRKVEGAYVDSLGFDVIDEWGRMIPDPERWPSSRGGKGFSEVATKVHNMGLKFGIHIMKGISTQAVNANTPILDTSTGRAYEESGRQWHARDIGIKEMACPWMTHGFMSVDTKLGAAKAFLRSLYQQYAEWGVDFVKHDCVFGADLDIDEITFASEVWRELNRPILYSLSPGSSVTPAMAKDVNHLVNMYRITGDDWDSWKDIASHFDISRDFSAANMIGMKGLSGKSWPDLDMLPLGWLTDQGVNQGPHRKCNLTLNEQRTQMTLWCMAKSPLMFGGDMRKLDRTTFNLITNPTLLEINSYSSHNREFPHISSRGLTFSKSSLDPPGISKTLAWRMISCKDIGARGWFNRALDDETELVCWNGDSTSKYQAPFCLFKRRPLSPLYEEMMYKQKYQRNFHLLSTNTTEFCLNASPNKRRTSKDISRGAFSPCRWDTNQLWELNYNGTLVSRYSGLCASIYRVEGNAIPGGIRSWIATGRRGEIFVAFFNLNSERTVISAKITDLSKGLPPRNSSFSSCSGREIWSGKSYSGITNSLSIAVGKHGCALFVLNCK